MSFILDALKKIERQREQEDKAKDEVRPVMEGGRRWGEARRSLVVSLGGIGVVAIVALVVALVALVRIVPSEQSAPPSSVPQASPGEPPASGTGPVIEAEETNPGRASSPSLNAPPGTVTSDPADLRGEPHEDDPSADVGLGLGEEPSSTADEELETVAPVLLRGRGAARDVASEAEGESSGLPEGFPELVLHGTSVVDGKPIAVINYQRLFVGDTIEGARVISITDRAVELEIDGRRFTIRL
jgi:hypothetical protein